MAWNNGFEEPSRWLFLGGGEGVAGAEVNAFRLFRFDHSAKLLNQTWNWLGLKTHQSLSPLQIGFLKKEGSLEEWGVTLHPFSFFK